ncbi:hypothetical protein HBB16_04560 [Pseudonocardia sp. MCCB 268]|nr:hypothetical protein [Pseudonocardia cytotoxica]
MDEPLSNLDAKLRAARAGWPRCCDLGATFVTVTRPGVEAMTVAEPDRRRQTVVRSNRSEPRRRCTTHPPRCSSPPSSAPRR